MRYRTIKPLLSFITGNLVRHIFTITKVHFPADSAGLIHFTFTMTEFSEVLSPYTAVSVAGIVAGAAFFSKKPKEVLYTFFSEFIGSLLLYPLFYIGCTFIITHESIPRGIEWIYHALCVVGLDFGTSGASMNPAISTGAWIHGLIDFWTLTVHLAAQIYASQFGFYSLKAMNELLGDELVSAIRGPSFAHLSDKIKIPHFGIEVGGEDHIFHAMAVEGLLTFTLALVIFLVEKRVKNGFTKIGIIAATIRICICFGENVTGANMNPMIAYSWLFTLAKAVPRYWERITRRSSSWCIA